MKNGYGAYWDGMYHQVYRLTVAGTVRFLCGRWAHGYETKPARFGHFITCIACVVSKHVY